MSTGLRITTRVLDDAVIVGLVGEATSASVRQLLPTVKSVVRLGVARVVLDGRRLVFADPDGIRTLARAYAVAAVAGAWLALADPQPLVWTALTLSDHADMLPVFDSVRGALARDPDEERSRTAWHLGLFDQRYRGGAGPL